jgi:hypothetical protein
MNKSLEFLARWSRLKRAAAEKPGAGPEPAAAAPQQAPDAGGPNPEPKQAEDRAPSGAAPEASLPALETIDRATAMGPFLRQGVPEALQRAALRRAWVADPAIRDFVGLAENQWDFTDPSGLAGFGPLGAADDVARLVSRALGELQTDSGEQPAGKVAAQERSEPADPAAKSEPAPAPKPDRG